MFSFNKSGKHGEDALTGACFGLMRFLPPEEFLIPFLRMLDRENTALAWENMPPLSEAEFKLEPWPTLALPPKLGKFIAETAKTSQSDLKGGVEPDAMVRLRWRAQDPPVKYDIIVESEWSKPIEPEQLCQQWVTMCLSRPGLQFGPPPDGDACLLLVNSRAVVPQVISVADASIRVGDDYEHGVPLVAWMSRRLEALFDEADLDDPPRAEDVREALLHCSWFDIADLALQRRHQSYAYRTLYEGLLEYLALEQFNVEPTRSPRNLFAFLQEHLVVPLERRATSAEFSPESLSRLPIAHPDSWIPMNTPADEEATR